MNVESSEVTKATAKMMMRSERLEIDKAFPLADVENGYVPPALLCEDIDNDTDFISAVVDTRKLSVLMCRAL